LIHCRTLENINRRDKDCTSDGSERERLVRRTDVRVLGITKDKGDRVPSRGKSVASEPPRSAHLCKKLSRTSEREREKAKGETKGKKRLEYDVRSTMTSIVSVKGFSKLGQSERRAEK
jgi:hypothetical protein